MNNLPQLLPNRQDQVLFACRAAIGKRFTVKRWPDSNVTVTGTIISCEPAGCRRTPRTLVQKFKIVLDAENPKREFEFVVSQLPR